MPKPELARSRATLAVAAAFVLVFAGVVFWLNRGDRTPPTALVTPAVGDGASSAPEPTAAPAPRSWLTGHVYALADGRPIIGARVSLSTLTANPLAPRRDCAVTATDATGAYTFVGRPEPDDLYVFVQARCDGFAAHGIDPHDWEPENLTAPMLLENCVDARHTGPLPDVLLEPALPIRGQALLPSGEPAQGGWVFAFCEAEGGEFACDAPGTAIESNGRFTVWATGARAILQVWVADAAPGCTPVVEIDAAHGAAGIKVRLSVEHEITVRVCGETDRPIADACVRVRLAAPLAPPVVPFVRKWHSTRAGVGGEHKIRGVPLGTVEIDAYHADRLPDEVRATNAAEPLRPLVLRPACILTARFTHAVPPVIGFETQNQNIVMLRRGDLYQSLPLEPDAERGQILAAGYLPRIVARQPGVGTRDLGTLTLDAGQDIDVHVRDLEKRAVPSAQVTCLQYCADELTLPDCPVKQSSSAATDANGNVRLGGFALGEVELSVAGEGYCRERVRAEILDPSGGPLSITLTRAAAVRFRVLDPDGRLARSVIANGVDEIGVSFEPASTQIRSRASAATVDCRIDVGGFITRSGLIPGEPHSFSVIARDLPDVTVETGLLEPGELRELPDVQFKGGGDLVVIARTPSGAPLEEAFVALNPADRSTPSENMYGASASDGRALFRGLRSGLYEVVVTHDECVRIATQRAFVPELGATEVTFVLTPGARYEGIVQFSDGTPVENANVSLTVGVPIYHFGRPVCPSGWTDSSGRFRLEQVPTGSFRVYCYRGEVDFRTPVAAELSDFPRVLTLERGATIELLLSSTAGREINGDVRIHTRVESGEQVRDSWLIVAAKQGRVVLEDLRPVTRNLEVIVEGYRLAELLQIHLVAGTVTQATIALEPEELPGRVELRVRVVNALGAPIRDARLEVESGTYTLSPLDDKNVVELPVAVDENATLRVSAPGYLPETLLNPAALAQGLELVVVLELVSLLRVSVYEQDHSTPLEDLQLRVVPLDWSHSPAEMVRDSGNESDYLLELRSGSYGIEVRDQTGILFVQAVAVNLGAIQDLKIVLPPVIVVKGQLTDNRRPVMGGSLDIRRMRREDDSNFSTADVNHQGNYLVKLRSAGRYDLTYSDHLRDGLRVHRAVEITESTVVNLDWTTIRVRGRLVAANEQAIPYLSGMLYGPSRYQVETDSAGAFSVSDVIPGIYKWTFDHAPTEVFAHGIVEIDGADKLTLVAPRARIVAVNIVGDAGYKLGLWLMDRWIHVSWRTNIPEPLTVVLPIGALGVTLYGNNTIAHASLSGTETEPVTLTLTAEPSATIDIKVDLVRFPDPVEVAVRELNLTAPASVQIWPIEFDGVERLTVRPGRVQLTLRSGGRAVHEITIDASAGAVHELNFP